MNKENLISVCLCTCFRPDGLKNVLTGLACQNNLDGSFEIIIIDNDAQGSAEKVVQKAQTKYPELSIHYDIEPQKNISLARNKSLSAASGEWIAFIDDDEIPAPEWLSELIKTALAYKADGVFGPVISVLPEECPKWVAKGKFFEKSSFRETGENLSSKVLRTSNALIRTESIKRQENLFDPQYGLTGGEDFKFFSEMLENGAKFVWSNEAIVKELVPLSRTKTSWIMKRNFRNAQSYADRLISKKGKSAYLEIAVRGLAGIVLATLLTPLSLPFGLHNSIWWLRRGSQGLGYLMSFTGYRYEPYRTE